MTTKDAAITKPRKGDTVEVKTAGNIVEGEEWFASIVTKIYDENEGMTIKVTAFPPNGYTLPVDAAVHDEGTKVSLSRWRWPPAD